MGTTYTVRVIYEGTAPLDTAAIHQAIEEELDAVDSSMSTYRADSELSRFNASTSTDDFEVSPPMAAVLREAIEIGKLSDGAYDITIEPLVRLWNFGVNASDERTVPSDQAIQERRKLVGQNHLSVSPQRPIIKKDIPKLHVDLSSIAKGYAVDRVAERLEREGIDRYMVEVGGEVRTRGNNRQGRPWQIAIERPIKGARQIYRVVPLNNQAMATSGDYRNYFETQGHHYSHLIDPRTGKPIAHHLASVSVIADRCAKADALATAMIVMGPKAAMQLAESQQIAASFLIREGEGFIERHSSTFPATSPPPALPPQ